MYLRDIFFIIAKRLSYFKAKMKNSYKIKTKNINN